MLEQATKLPPSRSNFILNLCAGGIFFFFIRWGATANLDNFSIVLLGGIAMLLFLLFGEYHILKSPQRPRVGLKTAGAPDRDRIGVKLLAYYATLALCLVFYKILPAERFGYGDAFSMALIIGMLPVIGVGGWYIAWLDSRLRQPYDSLWHTGNFLTGRWASCDFSQARKYGLSILLRAYYLPMMFTMLLLYIGKLQQGLGSLAPDILGHPLSSREPAVLILLLHIYFFFSALDVMFGTLGYACPLRFFDTDVRSTSPTLTGWIVCLACYAPFFDQLVIPFLLASLFANPQWFSWLQNHPVLMVVWGVAAIGAMCFESMVTTNFGLRFSNLTYRGIITGGLFRFTKHPQYIAKMLNRFLVLMPFLSPHGFLGVVTTMSMFAMLCFLYFLRARTEEIHLGVYPEYVQYAAYIEQHGIFRWVGRRLPFLRFSEERSQTRRLFR